MVIYLLLRPALEFLTQRTRKNSRLLSLYRAVFFLFDRIRLRTCLVCNRLWYFFMALRSAFAILFLSRASLRSCLFDFNSCLKVFSLGPVFLSWAGRVINKKLKRTEKNMCLRNTG